MGPPEEEDEKLKALMSSYVTTTDAPAIFFVDEFCRLYPDAIVICSIRDLEKWWDSYQDLVKAVDGLMENVMQLFSSTERYTILWKLAIVKSPDQTMDTKSHPTDKAYTGA
ncbi:putative nad dependent epimerase dehydratase protein [Eutypa lata UCREL1]|uniref:Putative nad dependent epimerase dehydratase protein n=1 Tax=Eutypa lata (strain UCR-EL1) TaxID=1287681 RepID=M7SU17_EUTLA|nr:putative nad dependent epimerase dehydratase protein [Eutypa lata UCREL1]